MSKLRSLAFSSALVLGLGAAKTAEGAEPPDAIVGEWWTEGREGKIRFVKSADGTYVGIIAGNATGKDINNKDPAMRSRPLLGIVLIWNLRPVNGEYVDGYVYNPRNGDTYRMQAALQSKGSLKIRGYVGISLLGQSQVWTRAQ